MLKPIKLQSNTFFLGDPHLRHNRDFVYGARGFKNVIDHDREVLNSINGAVGPEDNLVLLGDFSLNSSVEDTKSLFRQIHCQNIYKIWGNHESYTSKIYQEAKGPLIANTEVYPLKWENVTFLGHYAEFSIEGNIYICFHYPISVWNHMSHNARHICGHSHGGFSETRPEARDGKKLDVGWDVFRGPISFQEIERIMNKKSFMKQDHHE
jgi:calcineurin-like phosphoesterase family protein